MTKTQDVCGRCSKTINGRQQYIACTGTCNRRFHCRCVNIAAAEYELLVQNGVSTYECHECTKLPGLDSAKLCSDDVHSCVDPSGDAGEEQPDKEEGPGDNADLRTIILQLCRKVDALSSEVQALRADNEQLHLQLARNAELLRKSLGTGPPRSALLNQEAAYASHMSAIPSTTTNVTVPSCSTSSNFEARRTSYASALRTTTTGGDMQAGRQVRPLPVWNRAPNLEHGDPFVASTAGIRNSRSTTDEDGYTLVQKKRRVRPATGTNSTSKLTAVPRPPRSRALFVSRLDPTTTVDDIAAILSNVVKTCVCTPLPSRHVSYASFHIAVEWDDFDKVNDASVWPIGCLFRQFFGLLRRNEEDA